MSTLKWLKWHHFVTSKFSLEIYDINKLKSGDKLEVFILDKDFTLNSNKSKQLKLNKNLMTKPEYFFRNNRAIYTHKSGLSGTLILHSENKVVTLNEFEFHLECEPNQWHPLQKGFLSKYHHSGTDKIYNLQHWTSFSQSTRVGFEGPMILWSDLRNLPDIHWKNVHQRQFTFLSSKTDSTETIPFCSNKSEIYFGYNSKMVATDMFTSIMNNLHIHKQKIPDKVIIYFEENTSTKINKIYGYRATKKTIDGHETVDLIKFFVK